jgi:hypothetical protein
MAERRFRELHLETMTPEQRTVHDAIASGPRGSGLIGPLAGERRNP